MKKIALALLATMALFSCKEKEEAPVPDPAPKLPIIVRYDINQQTAFFVNNLDPNDTLFGYVGNYGIKHRYQYKDYDNTVKQAFEYLFTQNDTGSIYITGSPYRNYAVLRANRDLEGYHLAFKADIGYDIFDIVPAVLNDNTPDFTITRKSNGRTLTIPADEFIKQGFMVILYDK